MGSGHRTVCVRLESCAAPLCLFDRLASPKIEDNGCGANYPNIYPYPAATAVRSKRSLSLIPIARHAHAQMQAAAMRADLYKRQLLQYITASVKTNQVRAAPAGVMLRVLRCGIREATADVRGRMGQRCVLREGVGER